MRASYHGTPKRPHNRAARRSSFDVEGRVAFAEKVDGTAERIRSEAADAESRPRDRARGADTPDNFKCKPGPNGTSSVMIMNGTDDPLVPFDGGNVSFFGFSYKYGKVMSSRQSAQYFADLNAIAGPPQTSERQAADGVRVEQVRWSNSKVEVELVAIHGGGHGSNQARDCQRRDLACEHAPSD